MIVSGIILLEFSKVMDFRIGNGLVYDHAGVVGVGVRRGAVDELLEDGILVHVYLYLLYLLYICDC